MPEIKLTIMIDLTKLHPQGLGDRTLKIPLKFHIGKDEHFEGAWIKEMDD